MAGLRKDCVSWKFIFTFELCYGFLFKMPIVLVLLGNDLMVGFLKTWFLWSYCLVCQVSMLFIRNSPWMIFILGRRTWGIAKIWYFPLLVEQMSWLCSLICLKRWLGELLLCKVKRIFSYFLWKLENFWYRLLSAWIQIYRWQSYAIVFARKSFKNFSSKFRL